MAVSQMSAMRQIQSEDGVAGLQDARVRFHVGLRSRVRLHVRVLGSKKFLRPVARQVFDNVSVLASSVIPLAGIALSIFVGEYRTCSFEHGFADEILRGNQLQTFVLAASLVIDRCSDLWISFGKRAGHCRIFHGKLSISILVYLSFRGDDSPRGICFWPETADFSRDGAALRNDKFSCKWVMTHLGLRASGKCSSQERPQMPAVNIFVGSFAGCVMTA